ncbi:MAG TPA: SpoIIE family protein phosphatase, partial [Leptospiraceae bacterium]|nr:SpoIIE family protein phosphatase [Leptospiraceae bacterium]
LLDDETGRMHALNAGHPPIVLFRDGKASFLGENDVNQKIGESFVYEKIRNNNLKISHISLNHQDVLFFGSDGKDDVLLKGNDSGKREINSSDQFFLACLEEAKGDIYKVESVIQNKASLMDDYSLLRIEFTNSKI